MKTVCRRDDSCRYWPGSSRQSLFKRLSVTLALGFVATSIGCSVPLPRTGDPGVLAACAKKAAERAESSPKVTQEAKKEPSPTPGVNEDYAVGVIPTNVNGLSWGTKCPVNSQLVRIGLDDEDDDTEDESSSWLLPQANRSEGTFCWGYQPGGWLGEILGYDAVVCNSELAFCKVDGSKFRPLTKDVNDEASFYAVLKLGKKCPPGAIEFMRHLDNEDDDNENWHSGPISPSVLDNNTSLKFCFFRSGSETMAAFPDFGTKYAVFHDFDGEQPAWIKSKRYAKTDDEDDDNEDWTSPDSTNEFFDFNKLIGGSRNTMFDMGRVR